MRLARPAISKSRRTPSGVTIAPGSIADRWYDLGPDAARDGTTTLRRVDVDRFIGERQEDWQRLDALTRSARRPRQIDADDITELVGLYQRVSADLSTIRSQAPDRALVARLTRLVAAANTAIYGSRRSPSRTFVGFFAGTFPAAVWHLRRFVLASAIALLVPMLVIGWWIGTSDDARDASAPQEVRDALIESEFEDYYSSEPAGQFSTRVFLNNVQVAILAFAAGVGLGLGTLYILAFNGMSVGLALGLFTNAGQWQSFWVLILPHGLLELAAVIVAGAAGLSLGWAIISPGDRPRRDALAEAGRRSVSVVVGLITAFAIAGMIEGFVTPSPLPSSIRLGIGLLAFAAFVLWIVAVGRPAGQRGLTGLPGEQAIPSGPPTPGGT